jgi:hypothetical protein
MDEIDDLAPHEHCQHLGGVPFGINAQPNGRPQIVGQLQVCCTCGAAMVTYIGVIEAGHGPHVIYQTPPAISVGQIAVPNGLHR